METANAARAPPKRSSGIVYTLTLTAETARMLSEIPAAVQPGVGGSGIGAGGTPTSPPTRQPRVRAATARPPARIHSSESQPPPKPPKAATRGGITAYQLASASARRCLSTKYNVVQFVQREYTLMFSAFAATKLHSRGERSTSRVLGSGCPVPGTGVGDPFRAIKFQSGIHSRPRLPVITNACRHP